MGARKHTMSARKEELLMESLHADGEGTEAVALGWVAVPLQCEAMVLEVGCCVFVGLEEWARKHQTWCWKLGLVFCRAGAVGQKG